MIVVAVVVVAVAVAVVVVAQRQRVSPSLARAQGNDRGKRKPSHETCAIALLSILGLLVGISAVSSKPLQITLALSVLVIDCPSPICSFTSKASRRY